MSAGAAAHSCYMLYNGISHDETPGLPGYTPEGDAAGNNGNVAVSSQINTSARSHVELWMSGPFHAIGILRPNLAVDRFRQVRPRLDTDLAQRRNARRAPRPRHRRRALRTPSCSRATAPPPTSTGSSSSRRAR